MPVRPTKKNIREAHNALIHRTKVLELMSESELENELKRIYPTMEFSGTIPEHFALLVRDALSRALERFYDL